MIGPARDEGPFRVGTAHTVLAGRGPLVRGDSLGGTTGDPSGERAVVPERPGRRLIVASLLALMLGCEGPATPGTSAALPDEPLLAYRNVETPTAYVGDDACTPCHSEAASAYREHAMARSFHRWTADARIEGPLGEPRFDASTGLSYAIIELNGALYQEEFQLGPGERRLHQLRRRIDYVMGSGNVARTYFTEENGRLFQLPLTWYRRAGWDFSPGYEVNNARFGRLMPNRCLACHGSYPEPIPFLEGKYRVLRPGIGCERCHGPGALHVAERAAGAPADSTYDDTIVNPKDLPFERRLDVCEQCHVHTPVTVLREGQDAFSYLPSQPLQEHAAFFKVSGSIDIVSHADRLRQSQCFVATRPSAQPLECATCHDPHEPEGTPGSANRSCLGCHPTAVLGSRLARSTSLSDHDDGADCVECHMPTVKERTVPHGTFTDHWIRVVTTSSTRPRVRRAGGRPIEPFYERDRTGPAAAIYQAMGEVVYATLAPDARVLSDAAERLDRALASDSTLGDAHFLLGVAFQQLGRADDAVRALERSVAIEADHPERLQALARAYETAGEDPIAVRRLYERALELQPQLAWVRADYADFLQAQGQLDDAERAYRDALAERPSLEVAAFNLGALLMGQGRFDDAAEAFRTAVRLHPALSEGLSPLLLVRATRDSVTGVRSVGAPLEMVRGSVGRATAVRLVVSPRLARNGVAFVNVPPSSSVRVLRPDGTLVRALVTEEGGAVTWDLATGVGSPVAGGLYRVQIGNLSAGRGAVTAEQFYIGVVRTSANESPSR